MLFIIYLICQYDMIIIINKRLGVSVVEIAVIYLIKSIIAYVPDE